MIKQEFSVQSREKEIHYEAFCAGCLLLALCVLKEKETANQVGGFFLE